MAATSGTISVGLDLTRAERDAAAFFNKARSLNINANSSSITRASKEFADFSRSLEFAQRRVISFSVVASTIYTISAAFKGVVSSVIEVEKALQDINVIFNGTGSEIAKLNNALFDISRKTGQSFFDVAEAAKEFSRQGLGLEETIKRTNAALILTRLSGLDVKDSIDAITASINSFASRLISAQEVVDKFAAVDAAFAVSSADLAEAVRRSAASAEDAGVSFEQLLAIVTAAQEATARGGAVIGNALKSVFTRVATSETIAKLRDYGIEIDKTKDGIDALKRISEGVKLNPEYATDIKKIAGGVYQINIVSAAIKDLGSANGVYARALKEASGATDEAIKRNERLNNTLASLLNTTKANLTQTSSKLGKEFFGQAIETSLGAINPVLEFLAPSDENVKKTGTQTGETFGAALLEGVADQIATVPQGVLRGLSNFFSSTGLLGIGAVLVKVFAGFAAYTYREFANLAKITSVIEGNGAELKKVSTLYEVNTSKASKLAIIEEQRLNIARQTSQAIQSQYAGQSTPRNLTGNLQAGGQYNNLFYPTGGQFPLNFPTPFYAGGQGLRIDPAKIQNITALENQLNGLLVQLYEVGTVANRASQGTKSASIYRQIYSLVNQNSAPGAEDYNRQLARETAKRAFDFGVANRAPNQNIVPTGTTQPDVGFGFNSARMRSPGFIFPGKNFLNRNAGAMAAFLSPVAAGIVQEMIGTETKSDRIAGTAVGGLFNIAGMAGTVGAMTGYNPLGIAAGAAIGMAQSLSTIKDSFSNTPELSKNLDELTQKISKTQEALQKYQIISDKIASVENGTLSVSSAQLVELYKQQSDALNILNQNLSQTTTNSEDLEQAVTNTARILGNKRDLTSSALDISKQFKTGTLEAAASILNLSTPSLSTGREAALKSAIEAILRQRNNEGVGILDQTPIDFSKIGARGAKQGINKNDLGQILLSQAENLKLNTEELKKLLDEILTNDLSGYYFVQFFQDIYAKRREENNNVKAKIDKNKELIEQRKQDLKDYIENINISLERQDEAVISKKAKVDRSQREYQRGSDLIEANRKAQDIPSLIFSELEKVNKENINNLALINKQSSDALTINNINLIRGLDDAFLKLIQELSKNALTVISDPKTTGPQRTAVYNSLDYNIGLLNQTYTNAQDDPKNIPDALKNLRELRKKMQQSIQSSGTGVGEFSEKSITNIDEAIEKITKSFSSFNETIEVTNDQADGATERLKALFAAIQAEATIKTGLGKFGFIGEAAAERFSNDVDKQAFDAKVKSLQQDINKEIADSIEAQRKFNLVLSEAVVLQEKRALLEGRITGDQYRRTKDAAREIEQDNNGGKLSGKSIGEAFRDEFAYGTRDLYDDLEKGAKTTAQTIKSSFSDAFKAMRDDGKDAGDAVIDALVSIGKKMGDIALDIALNNIFGAAFGSIGGGFGRSFSGASQGGLVRGYSTGGMVSGGSGTKDDVPALLSDGEYVVKKAAVQRYGPDVLRKINSGEAVFDGQNTLLVARGSSFDATFANTFTYNDRKKPTGGELIVDPNLSSFALEDANNPQNALRQQREETLFNYLRDKAAYDLQKANTLKAWKKAERNKALGALIQAGVSLVGIGVGYAAQNGAFSSSGSAASRGATNSLTFTNEAGQQVVRTGFTNSAGVYLPPGTKIGYASGGEVLRSNPSMDRNPVMLTGGEFVATRAPVNYYGLDFFNKLNRGQVQVKRMADGGPVGGNISAPSSNTDLSQIAALAKSFQKDPTQTSQEPSRGVNIVNNFNITVERGGQNNNAIQSSSTASNENNKGETANPQETEAEKVRKFTDKMANIARGVIVQELRPQGLLDFR